MEEGREDSVRVRSNSPGALWNAYDLKISEGWDVDQLLPRMLQGIVAVLQTAPAPHQAGPGAALGSDLVHSGQPPA